MKLAIGLGLTAVLAGEVSNIQTRCEPSNLLKQVVSIRCLASSLRPEMPVA